MSVAAEIVSWVASASMSSVMPVLVPVLFERDLLCVFSHKHGVFGSQEVPAIARIAADKRLKLPAHVVVFLPGVQKHQLAGVARLDEQLAIVNKGEQSDCDVNNEAMVSQLIIAANNRDF